MARTHTYATLRRRVWEAARDFTHDRFSPTEVDAALRTAITDAYPSYKCPVKDETLTYNSDTIEYTIPALIDEVCQVYLEDADTTKPWRIITHWYQLGTTLFVQEKYTKHSGQTMRVVGIGWPIPFIAEHVRGTYTTVAGPPAVHRLAACKVTSFAINAEFEVWGLAVGDYVHVFSPSGDQGVYEIATVESEVAITLVTAPYASDTSNVVFSIGDYDSTTPLSEKYMVQYALFTLFTWEAERGMSKDKEQLYAAAKLHYDLANMELDRIKNAPPVRRRESFRQ